MRWFDPRRELAEGCLFPHGGPTYPVVPHGKRSKIDEEHVDVTEAQWEPETENCRSTMFLLLAPHTCWLGPQTDIASISLLFGMTDAPISISNSRM